MSVVELIRAAGVVGAGGAGFPAHVKAGAAAEVVVANGAECEPLMHKDAELMAHHADRVVSGLLAVMSSCGAREGIIGLKAKHAEAVAALTKHAAGKPVRLHILGDFYPTGDEYVLVHETTGRLLPPGGIPPQVGVVVQNVETLFNVAAALAGEPVTRKFVTVAGAVAHPLSCAVPVGATLGELLEVAGGPTAAEVALLVGGALMGYVTRDLGEPVTKTTGGVIVLPADHPLVRRKERPEPAMHRLGKSACDQCSYCTELCPRFLLGYDVQPHRVMRSLGFTRQGEDFWSQYGLLCCECGLCTLYACPEDLYPREACQRAKRTAREKGLARPGKGTVSGTEEVRPHALHESRRVPLPQLVRRLALTAYDAPAPLAERAPVPRRVQLPLKQHIGAAAEPVVRVGDQVAAGQLVAEIPAGQLGARLHASISGVVRATEPRLVIEASGTA